ncbi:MAG: hypothetical protein AB7V77_04645 [Candidatus Woesearchaeota archaeon]
MKIEKPIDYAPKEIPIKRDIMHPEMKREDFRDIDSRKNYFDNINQVIKHVIPQVDKKEQKNFQKIITSLNDVHAQLQEKPEDKKIKSKAEKLEKEMIEELQRLEKTTPEGKERKKIEKLTKESMIKTTKQYEDILTKFESALNNLDHLISKASIQAIEESCVKDGLVDYDVLEDKKTLSKYVDKIAKYVTNNLKSFNYPMENKLMEYHLGNIVKTSLKTIKDKLYDEVKNNPFKANLEYVNYFIKDKINLPLRQTIMGHVLSDDDLIEKDVYSSVKQQLAHTTGLEHLDHPFYMNPLLSKYKHVVFNKGKIIPKKEWLKDHKKYEDKEEKYEKKVA